MNQYRAKSAFSEMTDYDFFLALEGVSKSLKKLDKTLILELKHLRKSSHTNILKDLLQLTFRLQGNYSVNSIEITIKEMIGGGKLR